MSARTPGFGLRKVAAASAVAVATAGLSVATLAPAAQAESDQLTYTCTVPVLGDKTFTVVADTNAPARLASGKKVRPKVTATVTIPEDVVGLIHGVLGARSVDGTAVVDTVVNGATKQVEMTVPSTEVPASGPLEIVATGTGDALRAGKAGSRITMLSGGFSSLLSFKKEDGSTALDADVPCTLDEGQDATVDTIKVVKAPSKTRATVKFRKAKKVLAYKTTVRSSAKVTGKVRLVIKRNGKKVRSVKVKLNKRGVAKYNLKRVKKGKYVATAKYLGNSNAKKSSDKVKVRVKRR